MTSTIAPTFTPAERKVLAVVDEHGTGDLGTRTFLPAGTVHRQTAIKLVDAGVLVFTGGGTVETAGAVKRPDVEYVGSAAEVELPEPTPEVVAESIVVELPEPDFTGYVLADGRIVGADHVFELVAASDTLGVIAAAKDEHLAEKAGHPGPFPNLAALRNSYAAKLEGKPVARVRDAATRFRNSVDAGTDETLVCTGDHHDSEEERVLPVTAFQLYESGRRRSECRACCKARVAAKKASS